MLCGKSVNPQNSRKEQLVEAIDALLSDGDVEENHLSSSWMAIVDRGT